MLVSPPFTCSIDSDNGSNPDVDANYTLSNNLDTIKLLVTAWDPAGDAGYVSFNFHVEKAGYTPENQFYTIKLKRDTAKIVLVLDKSGSMSQYVAGTTRSRLDTLKIAVEKLSEKLEQLHQDGDSIGITYFSSTVYQPSPANFPKDFIKITDNSAPVLSSTTIKNDLDPIAPGGMTAMGQGLLDAKTKLLKNKDDSPNTKRMVFLVTDGLQNMPPIVCTEGVGLSHNYDIQQVSPQIYNAVCTGAVTDYLNDYSANPKDSVRYFTLATWEAGLYPEILNAIAEKSGGDAIHVIPTQNLNSWLVMQMVNMLHEGSPQLVFDKSEDNISGDKIYSFELNALVKTLLIDLSSKNIDISIKKGETDMLPFAQVNPTSQFNMYSFHFPIIADSTIGSEGKWNITLTGNHSKPYNLSVIADDHYLNYKCKLNKKTYTVGETIEFYAKLSHLGVPLTESTNKVTAYVLKPGDDLGHLLSIYETSLCDTSNDDITEGVSQKFAYLLENDIDFYNAIIPDEQVVELTNLGNGEYTGSYNQTDISGPYNIIYAISGEIPNLGKFERKKRLSSLVINDGFSSDVNTFIDDLAPPAPSNLRIANLTETSFQLKWDPVYDNFGIDKYSIYQNGILINEANFNKCMVNIYELAPGNDYSYYITTQDASGNISENTENLLVTTLGVKDDVAPTAPPNIWASDIMPTTLTVNWDESTDNVGVSGYHVFMNGVKKPLTTSINKYFSTLQPESDYSFYVVAIDASGNISDASNTINITTLEEPDTQSPTAPGNLVAGEITQTSVYLIWESSNDNKGVVEYDIFENEIYLYSTENTEFYRANLAPEKSYLYSVVAKDEAGNISDKSNILEITTLGVPDIDKPTAPSNLIASNVAQTSLYLNWNESTDNVGVVQYHIYKNDNFFESTTETEFSITNLIDGTDYTFYVVAKDAAENISDKSNVISVSTLGEIDIESPTAPDNLIATNIGQSNVYLTWDASTDNKEVHKYIIFQNGDSLTSTSNTSKSVYGLSSNTDYIYYIIAQDAAKNISEKSNEIEVTTLEKEVVLSPPSNITATHITQTSFILHWDASTGNVGEVEYGIFLDGVFIDKTSNTKYKVEGLSASHKYVVHLIARDSERNISDASKAIKVKTLDRFVIPRKDYFKIVGIRIKPEGKFGYYLGPGFAPVIKFEYKEKRKEQIAHKASIVDESQEKIGYYPEPYLRKIKDNLDGSYDLIIGNVIPKTNPTIKITVRDNIIHEGPLYRIPLWFYIIIIITVIIILILLVAKQSKTRFYRFMWFILIVLLLIWLLHYTGQLFFLYIM
ncbi:fibronectin type III domain-containing protein, partial [Bacteroidota bacterium]